MEGKRVCWTDFGFDLMKHGALWRMHAEILGFWPLKVHLW